MSRAPRLETDFIEASVPWLHQYALLLSILLAGCGQKPAEFHHAILEFDTLINVTRTTLASSSPMR